MRLSTLILGAITFAGSLANADARPTPLRMDKVDSSAAAGGLRRIVQHRSRLFERATGRRQSDRVTSTIEGIGSMWNTAVDHFSRVSGGGSTERPFVGSYGPHDEQVDLEASANALSFLHVKPMADGRVRTRSVSVELKDHRRAVVTVTSHSPTQMHGQPARITTITRREQRLSDDRLRVSYKKVVRHYDAQGNVTIEKRQGKRIIVMR